MSDKTCATCKFYKSKKFWYVTESHMECEGPASSHVHADAADDTGLSSSFRPTATFGCSDWQAKD